MSPLLEVAILVGATAVMLALLVVARRREGGYWADPGVSAGVLGAARGPYAVILAFVILVAFFGFNGARTSSEEEAAAVRTLSKTAEALSQPASDDVRANLVCYARGVIALDWPAMGDGTSSRVVDDNAGMLFDALRQAETTGISGKAIDEIFTEVNLRDTARADRIAEAGAGIPVPVWIVLIAGSLTILAYVLSFANPAERYLTQALMVGSVTIVLVGGLILVWFLSHPYEGKIGDLEPVAMERVLDELTNDPEFSSGALEYPCDESGRPLS